MVQTTTAPKATLGFPSAAARNVALLALGVGAALVYATSLNFGLFNDDPTGNLSWLDQRSLLDIFTSASGYGFYRPAGFAVWKLLYLLLGRHDALALHAVSIFFHSLNTVGVWLIAYRVTRRQSASWAAAIVFALAPFSYEAVAYVAALFHPLLTFWVIAGLLTFDLGRRSGRLRFWALTLLCVFGALFTHENGVALIGLLIVWEILFAPRAGRRQGLAFLGAAIVATGLFLLIWVSMQEDLGSRSHPLSETVANAVTFLQAIAVPLLSYFRLTVEQSALLGLMALLVVGASGLAAWRTRLGRAWLFALLWIAITAAPTILFLPHEYVQGSPRLFYLTYVGIAFLWAMPFAAIAQFARPAVLSVALQVGLLALIVIPPVRFINCELALYRDGTSVVRDLARLSGDAEASSPPMFVNVPIYFKESPAAQGGCSTAHPWVHNGAIILPTYVNLQDVSRLNGGPDRPISGASIVGLDAIWPPRFGEPLEPSALRSLVEGHTVHIFDDKTWSFFPLSEVWDTGSPAPAAYDAVLGDELGLEQASIARQQDAVEVAARWRLLSAPRALTAFAHVYDSAGRLVAQNDAPLGQSGGRLLYAPFEQRQQGDVVEDRHTISLPADLPPGAYAVAVGVYDPATVVRLSARDAVGQALANDLVVIGEILLP